ncbi:type VI secretion system-associated protein [Helicobacter sp. 12S02232-10]|uniref:type VI secretion system contractile sheath small subunit n=1 Tax=Helicobacter sp. 12S02232-10 TaxID=1476197 RepID=UPI000BA69063|nr:type VI secretion system contractile sheath small subunit [Helicobacter sp. 12S02232-10]PAF49738.1 type VI secretion system-associated protein [Helicobacter sp. 12S02232-10]
MADSSIAPKERINISYKAKTNGLNADVELPMKIMVMANLTGGVNQTPLEDREMISINKINFNQVMEKMDIQTSFTVKNVLNTEADEMNINLKISSIKDFSPDNIVRQVPELKKLMRLRESLMALKGPMGNIPDFRKAVLNALSDKEAKEKLLLEISKAKEEQDKE